MVILLDLFCVNEPEWYNQTVSTPWWTTQKRWEYWDLPCTDVKLNASPGRGLLVVVTQGGFVILNMV